jgi:hypothetical protein
MRGTASFHRHRTVYLNDHLMASAAGHGLARRAAAENRGTRFGDLLAEIAAEIGDDRAELLELMRSLGIRPSRVRQVIGTAAERLGRLKTNGHLLRYSELSRMLELEMLSVGIEGKRELWEALRAGAVGDDRLDEARLVHLAARAQDQRSRLEPWRLAAATAALAPIDEEARRPAR